MSKTIYRYTRTIIETSHDLMQPDLEHVSPSQRQVIDLIDRYTLQLIQAYNQGNLIPVAQHQHYFRHVLIDILTPIVGYTEMLADGWLGQLHTEHEDAIGRLLYQVRGLMNYIIDEDYTTSLEESA
ncbi:MAG: hypothetical protein AAFV98_20150 [Chloroflexota bacterium]